MHRFHWLVHPQLRAIGFNLAGRAVSLLAPLLLFPAMLEHLGSTGFGVWVTGLSITALAAFMDFGIGNSLLTQLAVYFGQSDVNAARRAIGASYRILGLVFLGGMAVFATVLMITLIWPTTVPIRGDSESALVFIVLFFFFVGIPLSVIYRVLYSQQQILLYNALLILQSGLSVASTLWAIEVGLSSLAVVGIYSAIPVVVLSFASLWYFSVYPSYRPRLMDFAPGEESRGLVMLGLAHLILGILTAIGMNHDIPLILYALDAEAVTNFSMPSRIGSLLLIAVIAAFMPLWSFYGARIARSEYQWLRGNAIRMSIWGAFAIALIGIILTVNSHAIMNLWVGRSFPNQELVIGTIAVYSVVIAMTSPWNMILNAAGQVRVQIWGWGTFVVLSIMGKLVLVPIYGPWIVSLVTAVCYLVCIFIPVLVTSQRLLASAQERNVVAIISADHKL